MITLLKAAVVCLVVLLIALVLVNRTWLNCITKYICTALMVSIVFIVVGIANLKSSVA